MSLKQSTVYRHLARIRVKLNVHTSIEMLQTDTDGHTVDISSIRLTPRGSEVLILTLQGVADKSIAALMGISYSAVRRHKEKMLYQNHCYSIRELAAKCRVREKPHDDS